MKIISLIILSVFWTLSLTAQSWNPYVAQGIISPAPLLPIQLNGTGVVSFNIGNTGSSPLPFDPAIPANNLKLDIILQGGVPNVTPLDPSKAKQVIEGSWAFLFNWVYDMTNNTYTGIQNQTLSGQSQGTIIIKFKVSRNSPKTQPQNGFNVNLTPPQYINKTNSASDDYISSYTCTESGDPGKN